MGFEDKDVYFATVQATLIKTLFNALGCIISDTVWEFSETEMKTVTLNKNKTITVYVRLYTKGFENGGLYYSSPGKINRVGMDISKLSDKFSVMKDKNHVVHLFVNSDSPNELHVMIDNSNVNSRREWVIKTIDSYYDLEEFKLREEDINKQYDVVVGIPATLFQQEIKYLNSMATTVEIIITSNTSMIIIPKGEKMMLDKARNILKPGDNGIKFYHTTPGKSIVSGTYKISDLLLFIKCTGLSSTSHVKLHMSMNEPMVVEYPIGDLGEIKFSLEGIVE